MTQSHTRRALSVAFAVLLMGTLGACGSHRGFGHDDGDHGSHWKHDSFGGRAWDPNGRRDWNDRDGRDRDRDGRDQDWR
jgi:hypothetical protein